MDIERLKHDRDYWDECDPTGAEATHYCADGGANPWVKEGHVWEDEKGFWREARLKNYDMQNPIPRPTRKQWSGPEDGLPPVGTKGATSGGVCDVLAVDEVRDQIAIRWHDGELGVVAVQSFRPLKSEKERVVEWALSQDCDPNEGMLSRSDFCAKLYDAGALKVPEES